MQSRQRLNPFALPSDTALRFGLLVLAVVGTTLASYAQLWRLSDARDERAGLCDTFTLPGFGSGESLSPTTTQDLECLEAAERQGAIWMLAGLVVLAITAVALYRVWPAVKLRRDRLQAIVDDDAPGVPGALAGLAARAGVRPPRFVWNPLNAMDTAVTFGTGRDPIVALGGGLVLRFYRDRPTFDAIVLHELAHVRNRDVPLTYAALATWRAFVLVALTPLVLGTIVPSLRHMPSAYREGDAIAEAVINAVALGVLVFLMRSAILRTRELYADVRASMDSEARPALRGLLSAASPPSRLAMRVHPDPRVRMSLFDDTSALFRMQFGESLGAGVAAGIGLVGMAGLVASLAGESQESVVSPGVQAIASFAVGPFAAAAVVFGSWQATISTAAGHRWSALPIGIGLSLGIMLACWLPLGRAANGDYLFGFDWPLVVLALGPILAAGCALLAWIWLRRTSARSPRRALLAAAAGGAVWFAVPLGLSPLVHAPEVIFGSLGAGLAVLAALALWPPREVELPDTLVLDDAEDRAGGGELVAPRPLEPVARPASTPTAGHAERPDRPARTPRRAVAHLSRPARLAGAGGLFLLLATFAPWYGSFNAYDSYNYTKQALLVAAVTPLVLLLIQAAAARLMTARVGVVRSATSSILASRFPNVAVAAVALAVLAMVVLSPGDDPSKTASASAGLYVGVAALALIAAGGLAAALQAPQVKRTPTGARPLGELGRAHEIAAGEMVAAFAAVAFLAFLFLNWSGDDPAWTAYSSAIYPLLLPVGLAFVLAVPRAPGAWALETTGATVVVAASAITVVLVAAAALTTGAPGSALDHLERYLPLPLSLAVAVGLVRALRSRALFDVLLVMASLGATALVVLASEPSFDSGGTGMRLGVVALIGTAIGGVLALVERRAWRRGFYVRPGRLALLGTGLGVLGVSTTLGAYAVLAYEETPSWCDPCTSRRVEFSPASKRYRGDFNLSGEHFFGSLMLEAHVRFRAPMGSYRALLFTDITKVRRFRLRPRPPREVARMDDTAYALPGTDLTFDLGSNGIRHRMIGVAREGSYRARVVLWGRLPRLGDWVGRDQAE